MKFFFLLNPSQPKLLQPIREAAHALLRSSGQTPIFSEVNRAAPQATRDVVREALAKGVTRIVAVGGDGTFNRVVRELVAAERSKDVEVGFVPAGTCNDFVRQWGARRRRWREALRTACRGTARAIDLGEMNGELFLNNAGFGRRPAAASVRRGPLSTLRAFQPLGVRIAWDRGQIEGEFFMGLVCNGPFFSAGLHFSRRPRPDDGLLDVFLVPRMPKPALAASLLWSRLGRPLSKRATIALRMPALTVESDHDLWPQVDGEPPAAKPVRRIEFRLSRHRLLGVMPA